MTDRLMETITNSQLFPVGARVRVFAEFPTLGAETFDAVGEVVRRGGDWSLVRFDTGQRWCGRRIDVEDMAVQVGWMQIEGVRVG